MIFCPWVPTPPAAEYNEITPVNPKNNKQNIINQLILKILIKMKTKHFQTKTHFCSSSLTFLL